MKSVSVDSSQRFKDTSQAVEETVIRGRTTNYAALVTSTIINERPIEYKTIDDSCWEMTYRFANDPEKIIMSNEKYIQVKYKYNLETMVTRIYYYLTAMLQ